MTNGNSYSMAPVVTDAEGRYRFSNVPNGVVVLNGSAAHASQPCAAIATVNGANSVKDVQLQDSATTRPATSTDSPTLSGVVYGETPLGNQQPLAGTLIEFEYPPVVAATTVTDAQGRYAFCQLPAGRGGLKVWLNAVHFGGVAVSIIGDQVLDLHF
jgi:hypothetical protein